MSNLPPLPKNPAVFDPGRFGVAFSPAQVLAYAEEAVRAEREACAVICDELQEHFAAYKDTALLNGDVELSNAASGEPRACEAIAAAIRARQEGQPE